ncbi:MAG: 30S ribosomal protein S3 [Candidatus Nealsonbacteria bacterium CG01_land_8_20_14_3_00_12]|uniref:Small ribosomal subunit protein uS3 n=4 Tax=Candidatus Nealsoniibacteriota TaxID=1817911 RepID=A0A2M7EBJ7_9BACT|nr:MAG: 30S ribosomal protein S3 [Candidatus Nealsonbacteria bacterium CG01_land_8_20_14_3_00_12]PIW35069.1 MAG: 30S ribosomal protein S3 [Candidatus Nealsonbacteria bacterium CG15_BIG_FIL_POST_REV_8_21_14_020_37_12]PJA82972.1 MAG: 30S ribosomal protein S3 [Candidatus Nealsonbacteria bacterium CG_4_9_14_3_um_filter_37_29]
MTHRVHPKAFRIKDLTDWGSRWLSKREFSKYLEEDFKIREFLEKKLGKLGIEKIEIERSPGKINVIISSARPGLIIGRGGGGVEELKKELENKVIKEKKDLKIEIREVRDLWASAPLAAQWIAQQIEKRVRYRRVLKQALAKIMATKGVQGARVEVAGRLDGVEIHRIEWLKKGRLPRQTIRADIDYAKSRAFCTYGVVGVKVWIYKGEKF